MEDTRVDVQPDKINAGSKVRINYNGLLAKSGAEKIYLHAGISKGKDWRNVRDIEMHHSGEGWTTELEVKNADKLNFCFKDSANNWDNNNGHNWSYKIH